MFLEQADEIQDLFLSFGDGHVCIIETIWSLGKKKIFNKKTHYRNLEIDNKLNPAKTLEDQDERELTNWARKFHYDKKYFKIQDDWQKNLMKKKEKKAITKHNFENYVSYI